MQSCRALDSRKRPSFSWLVSSFASQLAEAEGAVSKYRKKIKGKMVWDCLLGFFVWFGFGVFFICVASQISMSWETVFWFLKYSPVLWRHCHCLWIYVRIRIFPLTTEGILTSLVMISFLPLSALWLWKAKISQSVLLEHDSLVQEPMQLTLVMLLPWEKSWAWTIKGHHKYILRWTLMCHHL